MQGSNPGPLQLHGALAVRRSNHLARSHPLYYTVYTLHTAHLFLKSIVAYSDFNITLYVKTVIASTLSPSVAGTYYACAPACAPNVYQG
jgi:hypothetical protein